VAQRALAIIVGSEARCRQHADSPCSEQRSADGKQDDRRSSEVWEVSPASCERRIPSWRGSADGHPLRSRPSSELTLAAITVVMIGAVLPGTPLGSTLGFAALPEAFFAAPVGMVWRALVLIEIAKWAFYRAEVSAPRRRLPCPHARHQRHRAAPQWRHVINDQARVISTWRAASMPGRR
jgi:hypothetical protein